MIEAVSELHTAFQQLVKVATGVPVVILANQGRDAPTGLHATYNPVPVRAIGAPRRSRIDVPAVDCDVPDWTDIEEITISQMKFMLSVNLFNEGAKDAAWKLHNANFRYSVRQVLWVNQMGWRGCSEVRNLTSLMQASLQPRYQVDMHLVVETSVSDLILRAAGFSFEIYDESGQLLTDGVSP